MELTVRMYSGRGQEIGAFRTTPLPPFQNHRASPVSIPGQPSQELC